jgi:ABC-type branched-subunit amino acid transport system ATPase component
VASPITATACPGRSCARPASAARRPPAAPQARFLPFGHQRRLEIARALATRPRLLLLDEPAAGLTTQEIDELEVMIRKIAGLGVSVLLIEHHVDLIMAVADTVTVLDYGQVIASDRPETVQADPRVIEAYFGGPSAILNEEAA